MNVLNKGPGTAACIRLLTLGEIVSRFTSTERLAAVLGFFISKVETIAPDAEFRQPQDSMEGDVMNMRFRMSRMFYLCSSCVHQTHHHRGNFSPGFSRHECVRDSANINNTCSGCNLDVGGTPLQQRCATDQKHTWATTLLVDVSS